jgi:hypothetical protein
MLCIKLEIKQEYICLFLSYGHVWSIDYCQANYSLHRCKYDIQRHK